MSARVEDDRCPGAEGGAAVSRGRGDELVLGLIGRLIRSGSLDVTFPDGRRRSFGDKATLPSADITMRRPGLSRGLLSGGATGLAEAWMGGSFETSDLTALLQLAAVNRDSWLERKPARGLQAGSQSVRRAVALVRERFGDTHGSAPRGVPTMKAHYDLGNEFFKLWLDASMTYSSGIFPGPDATLEEAQEEKYRRIAEVADIKSGQRVLEIGSGWGGFAVRAARELGCRVVTITIADEQFTHVKELVRREALEDRVEVRLQDYRETRGQFDRIVSVEMIESIDESQWQTYFRQLHDLLVPGGKVGLQAIVIADRYWDSYRRHEDFIRTHIFPNSIVPAPGVLRSLAKASRLELGSESDFGSSYARTLAEWHRRFEGAWPLIAQLGFDERFRRMWRFYLSYCEAGFLTGRLGVRQIRLSRAAR